jgi:hypothetical protein
LLSQLNYYYIPGEQEDNQKIADSLNESIREDELFKSSFITDLSQKSYLENDKESERKS